MGTFLFVHGTGVRKAAYDQSFQQIETALAAQPGTIARCYWGGLGAQLSLDGASIPAYDTARSVTEEVDEIELWGLLYRDPLCELRALAARSGERQELPPGTVPPGRTLAETGKALLPSAELAEALRKGGIESHFAAARARITSSKEYQEALRAAPAALAEYRIAIARALVSEAALQAEQAAEDKAEGQEDSPPLPAVRLDAGLRDETVRLLVDQLGGQEYGLGGWVKKQLGRLAGRVVGHLGTSYARRKRGAVTDAAYPAAGDILLYQARGGGIRDFIRERIQDATPPVVVLAHSLGGIACVDLLIQESLNVDLLVTAGSQAPFLYEIGALSSLTPGEPLPETFPRWLNVYDRRDFLSYVGGKVFPGRVTDVEVDNRQPFPESHSAYWTNPAVWTAVFQELD